MSGVSNAKIKQFSYKNAEPSGKGSRVYSYYGTEGMGSAIHIDV